jgi:uncharacterized protein YlxP (DUF503 family)
VNVRLLTVNFYLGGCRSLKEKRQRLKGMRERFGRTFNVAVCESDYQDTHQRAQWSFIATAANGEVAERTLGDILRTIQTSVDAELIDVHQEVLLG